MKPSIVRRNSGVRRTPRMVVLCLGILCLTALCGDIASENVTLTTYYPAPSGAYTQMTTTGRTWLSRDSGGVVIGGSGALAADAKLSVMNGKVGIGTLTPNSTLEVSGGVRVGSDAAACAAAKTGTLRYNAAATVFEYCNGTAWTTFGSYQVTASRSGYTGCAGGLVNLNALIPAGKTVQSLVVLPIHVFDNDPHPEAFVGKSGSILAGGRSIQLTNMCGGVHNPANGANEGISYLEWFVTY